MTKENNNQEIKNNQYKEHKKEKNSTKLKRFLLFLVFGTLISFLLSFFFIKSYMVKSSEHNARLAEIRSLQKENEMIEEENEKLQQKVEYLKTDKGVESVAREKLGLVKPSEIAFVVVNDRNSPKSKKEKAVSNQSNDSKNKPIKVSDKKENINWFTLLWRDLFSGGDEKKK